MLVQVSNVLISRFSLILLICIAINVFFTAAWQQLGSWDSDMIGGYDISVGDVVICCLHVRYVRRVAI